MWRAWNAEQRVAAVAASLLIVSTLGPFSWVELAIVLVGVGVLLLLRRRAQGRPFHLPFGDGTVILAAGIWAAVLIVVRLFERPLGQNLLALACAAILGVAGAAERAKRPPDDLPEEPATPRAPLPAPDASRTETASPPPADSPPAGRQHSPRS